MPATLSASITSAGEVRFVVSTHPNGSPISWMLASSEVSARSAAARYWPSGVRSGEPQSPVARIRASEQRAISTSPVATIRVNVGRFSLSAATMTGRAASPRDVTARTVMWMSYGHRSHAAGSRSRSSPSIMTGENGGLRSAMGKNAMGTVSPGAANTAANSSRELESMAGSP